MAKKYTPDGLDKGLRIGCGALFGAFAALFIVRRLFRYGGLPLLYILVPIGMVLCAWLAYKKGDRFWEFDGWVFGERSFRYWLLLMAALIIGLVVWIKSTS